MNHANIKNELARIGMTYPSVMGLLKKRWKEGGITVGDHWATLLRDLPDDHLANVCDEYASCELSLPEQSDRLIFSIVKEVQRRAFLDGHRTELHAQQLASQQRKQIRDLIEAGQLDAPDWSADKIAARWKAEFEPAGER